MIDRLAPPVVPVPNVPTRPAKGGTSPSFNDWLAADQPRPDDAGGLQPDAMPPPDATLPTSLGDADLMFELQAPHHEGADEVVSVPDHADLVFEFHVHQRGRDAEVVSLPWRLSANGMLSQFSSSATAIDRAGAPSVPANPNRIAGDGMNIQPLAQRMAAPMLALPDVEALPAALSVPAATSPLERVGASESVAGAPMASIAAPWLSRLIRWIERPGQDATVWIRDFALDAAAARQLVDVVRAMAREQGVQLDRVVVNARELWRAGDIVNKENF